MTDFKWTLKRSQMTGSIYQCNQHHLKCWSANLSSTPLTVTLALMVMLLVHNVCVCWVGGGYLSVRTVLSHSVMIKALPGTPYRTQLSQPANWTGIAQPCSPRSTQPIQALRHTHTRIYIYIYIHTQTCTLCLSSFEFLLKFLIFILKVVALSCSSFRS